MRNRPARDQGRTGTRPSGRVSVAGDPSLLSVQITVTLPGGETATVDQGALALPDGATLLAPGATPEGFVSQAFHDARLEEVGRAKASDKKALKRQLKEDPAFVAEVAESLGIEVRDGKPVVPDVSEAVNRARATWDTEVLAPVKDTLDGLQSSLRQRTLTATLASLKDDEGRPLVREEFLAPGPNGAPSYAETVFGGTLRLSDNGDAVAVDAQGNPVPSSESGRAYATPSEHIRSLLSSDGYAHLRTPAPDGQRGPGFRGGGSGSGGQKRSAMSPQDKAAYVREHGQEAFQALPD